MSGDRHVAVIGGGIAGLAAAHAIVEGGARVTLFEAGNRLGGMILTTPFAGHPHIDEGADAFLARVPWAVDLARKLSLGDSLTSPSTGKAAVWWNGLHDIPEGLLLGLPTNVLGLARSRLLSRRGKARGDGDLPSAHRHSSGRDRQVCAIAVRQRGARTTRGPAHRQHLRCRHRRLQPPRRAAVGGDRGAFAQRAAGHTRRRAPTVSGPVFYAPSDGLGQLVDAVSIAVGARGGLLRSNTAISELAGDGQRWRVDGESFDRVVLACPARAASRLLATLAPSEAATLAAVPTADVALLTLAIPADAWPQRLHGLSGYLVPKPQQRLVTAVSFGSQKWAHWASADHMVVRVSLGRDGLSALHLSDDELVANAIDELDLHLALDTQPMAVRVSRWPNAFPQYRPHHGATIAAAERALPGGIALAGASYHGIGIPACIRSGQLAAAATLQR